MSHKKVCHEGKRCYGPADEQHIRACRKGRPLCRWRREKPCNCGAHAYPHRRPKDGSPCNANAWAMLDIPMRAGVALHYGNEETEAA